MKYVQTIAAVALLWTTCWPGSAEARECVQDAASFRADFEAYIADVQNLAAEVGRKQLPIEVHLGELVNEAAIAARNLTSEQEDALCKFFTGHPSARRAPADLLERVRHLPETLDRRVGFGAETETRESGPQCMPEDIRRATEAVNKVAELAGIVGQAICDAAPSGDVVVVNAVLCPIAGVIKGVAKVAEFVTKVDDVCKLFEQTYGIEQMQASVDGSFDEMTLRFDDLDGTIAPLAHQSSVEALAVQVDGVDLGVEDLDEELDSVRQTLEEQDEDRGEFQDLSYRLYVEELLGSDLNNRISLFQLPETVGGSLEDVREIVADTILMNEAANQDIGQALVLFAQGDSFFNSENYSQAFASYREAYREALQAKAMSWPREVK